MRANSPPSITTQPTSQTVTAGQTAMFSVAASGTSPLTYQWQNDGIPVSGATSPTYAIPTTTTSESGTPFRVVVSNGMGAATSTTVTLTVNAPALGTTYYLAPQADGGSDSNDGTSSGSPWLTPNHALNCGDVIIAAASSAYSEANFQSGKWGTVTCAAGNNVAWLKCATFDACQIATTTVDGMKISANYWGVQGWDITAPSGNGGCIAISPPTASASIHHIIVADNVLHGCFGSGLSSAPNGHASADYLAYVGNIDFDTAKSATHCYQGISIWEPAQTDSLPGTHLFVAGNFSWGNFDHNPCGGGAPGEGEGIIIDTLNGCQTGMPTPYTSQVVVQNNISIFNGGRGISVTGGCSNSSNRSAHVYFKYNTAYGNNADGNQDVPLCGEIIMTGSSFTEFAYNIAQASSAVGCGSNPIYGLSVANGDDTDRVHDNFSYGVNQQDTVIYDSGSFAYDPNNTFGTSPGFANPVAPGAPNCSGFSSVPNCMATVIADFTPRNAAAKAYGYQIPSALPVQDPLFPNWLCNVNLPPGLVTMGCLSQ